MALPKIGISVGDISRIGLEVMIRTLATRKFCPLHRSSRFDQGDQLSQNLVRNKVYLSVHKPRPELNRGKVNVVQCWVGDEHPAGFLDNGRSNLPTSLEAAVNDLKAGQIDGLVTAPIPQACCAGAGELHGYRGIRNIWAVALKAPSL